MTESIFHTKSRLRGAVGFSLAVTIEKEFEHRSLFIMTIIVVVMFTVFVQGIAIKPLVALLGIKTKDVGEPKILEEINRKVINHTRTGIDAMAGETICSQQPLSIGFPLSIWILCFSGVAPIGFRGQNYAREVLEKLNHKYFKRWLQRKPELSDEEDIFDLYQSILLNQVGSIHQNQNSGNRLTYTY